MDLSCSENHLNWRHGTYLMPGQELHETPDGDVSVGDSRQKKPQSGHCHQNRPALNGYT